MVNNNYAKIIVFLYSIITLVPSSFHASISISHFLLLSPICVSIFSSSFFSNYLHCFRLSHSAFYPLPSTLSPLSFPFSLSVLSLPFLDSFHFLFFFIYLSTLFPISLSIFSSLCLSFRLPFPCSFVPSNTSALKLHLSYHFLSLALFLQGPCIDSQKRK